MLFKEFVENRCTSAVSRLYQRADFIMSTLNPVEVVTPLDIADIKSHWLERAEQGIIENPTFYYDIPKLQSLADYETELVGLYLALSKALPLYVTNAHEEMMVKSFLHALQEGIETATIAQSIVFNDDKHTRIVVQAKYGIPTSQSTLSAYTAANNLKRQSNAEQPSIKSIRNTQRIQNAECIHNPEQSSQSQTLKSLHFNAAQIGRWFSWAMEQLDPTRVWPIFIDENVTAIDVRLRTDLGEPYIAIPASRVVTGLKLVELLGHEVFCHWQDIVTSLAAGLTKSDDERLHEGHALISDVAFHRSFEDQHYTPQPWYIIAIDQALHGKNFAQVAQKLLTLQPQASLSNIWARTYRIFRGSTNPGDNKCGYAFTKDLAYFEGYALAQNYPENLLKFSILPPDLFAKYVDSTEPPSTTVTALEFMQKAATAILSSAQSTAEAKAESESQAEAESEAESEHERKPQA